jgi:hypothetical protein
MQMIEWEKIPVIDSFLLAFALALIWWVIDYVSKAKPDQNRTPASRSAASACHDHIDENPRDIYKAAVSEHPATFPLSARWLASSHDPDQPLAYALRGSSYATGLRLLRSNSMWLELDPCCERMCRELRLKAALLGDGSRYSNIVSAFEDEDADDPHAVERSIPPGRTLAAQREVLHRVLSQVVAAAKRACACSSGPHYSFEFKNGPGADTGAEASESVASAAAAQIVSVRVAATGMILRPSDPQWANRPLALAALLVQEDFILLRKGQPTSAGDGFTFVVGLHVLLLAKSVCEASGVA